MTLLDTLLPEDVSWRQNFTLEDLSDPNSELSQLAADSDDAVYNDTIGRLRPLLNLITTQGINITVASAIGEILPNFITEQVPITSYTVDSSTVNKGYALGMITEYIQNVE